MHVVQSVLSRSCSPVLNLRSTIPVIKINTSFSGLHSLKKKRERTEHYHSAFQTCIFFLGFRKYLPIKSHQSEDEGQDSLPGGKRALGFAGSLLHHPSPRCSDLVKRDAGKAHNSSDPGDQGGQGCRQRRRDLEPWPGRERSLPNGWKGLVVDVSVVLF